MTRLRFAQATDPPKMALPKWWLLPLVVAVINGAMALAQLASFETFAMIIGSYGLLRGQGALVLALIITALEILSLPVLLKLRLSPAMRAVSAASVFLVPLLWLQLTLWPFIYSFELINAGYFGAFLSQPYGWWLILEVLAYLGLSLFALKAMGGDKLLSK